MPKPKIKRIRGSRTCGSGSHKNNSRGRGCRGGSGNAGMFKHKYIKAVKEGYEIGKYGFNRPKVVRSDVKAVKVLRESLRELKSKLDDYTYRYLYSRPELNVGELSYIIDRLAKCGLAEKDGEVYSVNLGTLGYSKLLGAGNVDKAIRVTVLKATPKAIEKIEAAGGSVETL
jgi:large subunit ribosomal protein L15